MQQYTVKKERNKNILKNEIYTMDKFSLFTCECVWLLSEWTECRRSKLLIQETHTASCLRMFPTLLLLCPPNSRCCSALLHSDLSRQLNTLTLPWLTSVASYSHLWPPRHTLSRELLPLPNTCRLEGAHNLQNSNTMNRREDLKHRTKQLMMVSRRLPPSCTCCVRGQNETFEINMWRKELQSGWHLSCCSGLDGDINARGTISCQGDTDGALTSYWLA